MGTLFDRQITTGMEKITDILFCEVESDDGRRLGRLFDVRCAGEPEHGLTNEDRPITELVYGGRGLLEMLGFKQTDLKTMPWSSVKEIKPGKIIIAKGNGKK